MALACACMSEAQTAEDSVYVYLDDQPDGGYFLPAPPDTSSVEFQDDLLQWLWGKSVRNSERGAQASRESEWKNVSMMTMATELLGLDTINAERTPALFRLITKIYNTGSQATKGAKKKYMRKRPFLQMNEHLWSYYDALDEDFYRTNGSYPSGHTSYGWATALVLTEMWPELQDTILRRGFQYGESRVIGGPHWQSDVNAGYLCGAASVARAHANGDLLHKDILAARKEYAILKGLPRDYDPVSGAGVLNGEKILGPQVDAASYRYISDVRRYWAAKPLRLTERGQQALSEAECSTQQICRIFGEAMGITISEETTPAICALICAVADKSHDAVERLKTIRFRNPPFEQLGEPAFIQSNGQNGQLTSSFPSEHTHLGWAEALIMAEVAPEKQDEILRRGYQYGQNSLISGLSWFTDIEATRQLSCAIVARLHNDPDLCKMIAKARKEWKRKGL